MRLHLLPLIALCWADINPLEPFRSYNASLPIYPVLYNDSQKAAQTQAGTQMLANLDAFCSNLRNQGNYGQPATFTVPPGVYRVSRALLLQGVLNVKLVLANVEIISTGGGYLGVYDTSNIEVAGPVTFDTDPLPTTQGVVVGTDLQTYVDVQPMPGYRPPQTGGRVMYYTPDGVMQRHFQNGVVSVTGIGNNTYRVRTTFLAPPNNAEAFYLAQTVRVGNYMSTEGNGSYGGGGIDLQNNGDLYIHDIGFHGSGLISGNRNHGVIRLDKFLGQRRPGTNRLGAGGYPLILFNGGSLDITNSEIAYNYDDLTDIEGYMGNAAPGPKPNQVYMLADYKYPGRHFNIYDAKTLQLMGKARLTSVVNARVNDSMQQSLQNTARSVGAGTSPTYSLVSLDIPIAVGSGFYFLDDIDARPKLFSIRNSYLHDSLAAGIQIRGASSIVVTGTIVARAAINCMQASFSGYWNEGAMPLNVLFDNNTCIDSPYSIGQHGPSIGIYTESFNQLTATNTKMFSNVTISNNLVFNPQTGGIHVALTSGVKVVNNQIYNVGKTSSYPTTPGKPIYGISIQTSEKVVVQGNNIINNTVGFVGPLLASQVLVTNMQNSRMTMQFSGNTVNGQPIQGPNYAITPPY